MTSNMDRGQPPRAQTVLRIGRVNGEKLKQDRAGIKIHILNHSLYCLLNISQLLAFLQVIYKA